MKKTVIISALGEKTFTEEQLNELKSSLDVAFISCPGELSAESLSAAAKDAEILGLTRRCIKEIDSSVIESLPSLKYLSVYSTGTEWIDIPSLIKRGILLNYLPDYSTQSVAEHAVGCILSLTRRIHLSNDFVRGRVPAGTSLRGAEICGKKAGIIGYGRIGKKIASLLEPFGAQVIFSDPRGQENAAGTVLNSLLSSSDIIILACSKKRNAPPILSYGEIGLMKKSAVIINIARAGLVDHAAVVSALKNKNISGYAVDDKVDILSDPSIEHGRVLQTGHTAWYSDEAMARGTACWAANILSFASEKPENLVKEISNGQV